MLRSSRLIRHGPAGTAVDSSGRMAKPRKRHDGDPSISDTPETSGSANGDGSHGDSPNPDRISMRAYELYLARGSADGQAVEDWLAAERELAPAGGPPTRGDSGE